MRKLALLLALFILAVSSLPAFAAIDRLQKEDFPRFALYMARLYYNIGKSMIDYGKTVFLGLDDFPKAVATDVFHIGDKGVPGAYYMTKKERRERERQKHLEEAAEKELDEAIRTKKGQKVDLKDSPITQIKP